MSTTLKLSNGDARIFMEHIFHISVIGSLLYLIASRLDIPCIIGVCTKTQGNPKISHLNVVRWVIKYINDTCDYDIWFLSDSHASIIG